MTGGNRRISVSGLAMPRDQSRQAFNDLLEESRARIDAVDAHRLEQGASKRVGRISQFGKTLGCIVHAVCTPILLDLTG